MIDQYLSWQEDSMEKVVKRNDKQPLLLVVALNSKLVEKVLEIFESDYKIEWVFGGMDGYQYMLKNKPSVIVADYILKDMCATELCKMLKMNEHIEFIPFVVYSSSLDTSMQIKSLQKGVTDVFNDNDNYELLRVKISNFLNIKYSIQNEHSIDVHIPEGVAQQSDRGFVLHIESVVKRNLDNPELNVDLISKEVGCGSNYIYRRLKKLTGMSIPQFVQDVRLRYSSKLLRTVGYSIKEVCYMSGFSNHSYFSRCFKARYGCSPSDYIEGGITI